jgi:hypothetical protein
MRFSSFLGHITSSKVPPAEKQNGPFSGINKMGGAARYYDLNAVKLTHGRLKLEISRGNVERPIGLPTLNIEYLCELSYTWSIKTYH